MFLFTVISSGEKRFEHYFNKYYKYACRVCLNIVHAPDVVEDIITISFFKAYDKLKDMTSEREAKIWIATIVRNDSKNYLKSKAAEQRLNIEPYEDAMRSKYDLSGDPLSNLIVSEAVDEIYNEIQNLSKKLADTMMLSYKNGMSAREIAELLNVPEKTVYGRIEKGTKRLKAALCKKGEVNDNGR